MNAIRRIFSSLLILISSIFATPALALEIQHFIEGKEHADIIADATGLKITDDGVIYVTSEEKASLLKIVDGKIAVFNLQPDVFSDSDLGGIDLLANGNLVVVNQGSSKVAVIDPQRRLKLRFSQSGGDPGELDKPKSVVVSINNNIYVGDLGSRQISVFNDQGLFLHSFGRHGSGGKDIQKPTHISLDADENIYILEGPGRFSIYDLHGNLVDRITSEELKDQFGEAPEFTAMTTDLNGTVYLGDQVNSQIAIFDWRNRKLLKRFWCTWPVARSISKNRLSFGK